MQLYLCFCWQHSSCCAGDACVVSLSLFMRRFDAARLGPSSPPCRYSRLLSFLWALMKSNVVSDPVFVVGRCIRGRNPSKIFGTIREQGIAATECLLMYWQIQNGRTNVTHDKGAGRPSTAITENNIERARDMVLLDKRVSIDEVAHVLQISHGSDYELMHNKLGFHKICARWVPKQLSEVHKQTRVDICQKHLHL